MKSYRKIALFCLFSWLVAAPLPLLAEQEKPGYGDTLGKKIAIFGMLYSLIMTACLSKEAALEIPKIGSPTEKAEPSHLLSCLSYGAMAGMCYGVSRVFNFFSGANK